MTNSSPVGMDRMTLITSFMGPTCDPPGADRTQVGPVLAPWTLPDFMCRHRSPSHNAKFVVIVGTGGCRYEVVITTTSGTPSDDKVAIKSTLDFPKLLIYCLPRIEPFGLKKYWFPEQCVIIALLIFKYNEIIICHFVAVKVVRNEFPGMDLYCSGF